MPPDALYFIMLLVLAVVLLLIYSRVAVTMTPRRYEILSKEQMAPESEVSLTFIFITCDELLEVIECTNQSTLNYKL
jgi:hypothetical protein